MNHDELRGLLIRRNEIADYLQQGKLPPTLQNDIRTCQWCHQLDSCTIYHRALENGTRETSGMGELFDKRTQHLNQKHLEYFIAWEKVIELEKNHAVRSRKEVWTITSEEGEKLGRCFSQMILESIEEEKGFLYQFRQAESLGEKRVNMLELQICLGDYVLISTEAGHFGLGLGIVRRLTEHSVVIQTEDELVAPPLRKKGNPQEFRGIMELEGSKVHLRHRLKETLKFVSFPSYPFSAFDSSSQTEPILWRIDKDELVTGFGVVKDNLLRLFVADGDEKRRKLIVDLVPPKFRNSSTPLNLNQLFDCL